MAMSIARLPLLLILTFLALGAQDAPKKGVSPSEREIDDLITKSTQSGAAGDKFAAIATLETALQKVQKDPSLKGRESDVLNRLGHAYLDAQRPAEAVRTFQVMLDAMKAECVPNSAAADRCAGAQYGMGTALMYKGDFQAAVPVLRRAIANFAQVVKGGYTEDYRMNMLKQQGDAQSLLAAALFRSGNKAEGIAAFERAVQEFSTVVKNPGTPEPLRVSAQTSLKDAQTSLDLLKKN
jgi:tetratricopeptide (TPR) repeat protein